LAVQLTVRLCGLHGDCARAMPPSAARQHGRLGVGAVKPTAVLVHPSGATGPSGPKGEKGEKGEKGDTGACSPIAHLHILTKAAHRRCTSSTCITRWLVAHDSRGQ